MKKYQNFLTENFQFLVVEFSIYLNRCVFIMVTKMYPLVQETEHTQSVFV